MSDAELLWEIRSEFERAKRLVHAASHVGDKENEFVRAYNLYYPTTATRESREKALALLRSITPESLIAELRKALEEFDNDITQYRPRERRMVAGDL